MRHMGNSGKMAIGAFLAALALLVLTVVTLHGTVALWFLAASVAAYVACVSEVVIRRRHRTLVASGIGSILFIAFGIAFLRQWGLAFNADPDAMSTRVDSEHPDLYFYLAVAAGALTLLLLFAGTVLPGRRRGAASSPRRRPATASRTTSRTPTNRTATNPATRNPAAANRGQVSRVSGPRGAPGGTSTKGAAPRPAAKAPAKSAARRPSATTSPRR
ncbi:hypothetical protein BJG92_00718 [Arthrobacter sp. SO5]|uniref:hypothetical protein n=1 Tax=Arthrobacter sp. SO5 TaxID=1897055 RepID=UPI001E30718D|nr:hypothetical protein [Arthrobacter sp. SO5]MCB5273203.1 hypothetical protein [Arthrobacter sp. SO5]